jgi:hypothetical protein
MFVDLFEITPINPHLCTRCKAHDFLIELTGRGRPLPLGSPIKNVVLRREEAVAGADG